MTRIDEQHGETARLQQLEQGDPVALGQPLDTGRFHGHGVDRAGLEPIGQGVKVDREAGKLAHRLIVSVRRDGHKVRRATDVDGPRPAPAGGIGVVIVRAARDLPSLRLTLRLRSAMLAPSFSWKDGAASGTSYCSVS